MATQIMPDNVEFNIFFVGLIEARPEIYNFKLPEYSNRLAIEKIWHEIAAQVKCPVEQCKSPWRHIRSSFLRHIRFQAPSGSAASAKKKAILPI